MDKEKMLHVTCNDAQRREKEVNLNLPLEKIEQLMTVSTPGRDPRELDGDHCPLGVPA